MSFHSLLRTSEETPVILIEKESVRRQLEALQLFGSRLWYSVKTQPDAALLQFLHSAGCGFHVCSVQEVRHVLAANVPAGNLLFYNPSATADEFQQLRSLGVRNFTADSAEQAQAIAAVNPQILFVRANLGVHAKSNRYGNSLGSRDALSTLAELNAPRQGLHVHVASQNDDLLSWQAMAAAMQKQLEAAKEQGIRITDINLGGGIPVPYHGKVATAADVAVAVQPLLAYAKENKLCVSLEPGRFVVAPASILVATVKAVRDGKAFVDTSVYAAALDTLIIGLALPVVASAAGTKTYAIHGSTSDSLDVFGIANEMPQLAPGDRLGFLHAAAYSFHSDFMQLPKPKVRLV